MKSHLKKIDLLFVCLTS